MSSWTRRSGVNDLDDGREFDRSITLVAEQLGGEQQQRGTNSLAAARTKIFANLRDRSYIRNRVVSELIFDRDNVVAQQDRRFLSR
jgi:hypothetical protein